MNNPHDPTKPSESAYGVPRIGPGLEGMAVHLATVAKWLVERDDVSLRDAWNRLLDSLVGLEQWAVYFLADSSAGYAEPMKLREEYFDSSDAGPWIHSRGSPGIGRTRPQPAPAQRLGQGAKGFVAWLRRGHGQRDMGNMIVAESVARRLWGWGADSALSAAVVPLALVVQPSDWERLIAERNAADRFLWTQAHAFVIQAEETRRKAVKGAKSVRAAMAAEMSNGGRAITPQKLFQAMREHLPADGSKGKAQAQW